MKIPKAIELLQQDIDDPGSVDFVEHDKAQSLGIEALKRCQYIAEHTDRWAHVLLPGED